MVALFLLLTLFSLVMTLFFWRILRVQRAARKSSPLLQTSPEAYTSFWEEKYRRARLFPVKNAALLCVSAGLYAEGKPEKARERFRFVRLNDPFLDRERVYFLMDQLQKVE